MLAFVLQNRIASSLSANNFAHQGPWCNVSSKSCQPARRSLVVVWAVTFSVMRSSWFLRDSIPSISDILNLQSVYSVLFACLLQSVVFKFWGIGKYPLMCFLLSIECYSPFSIGEEINQDQFSLLSFVGIQESCLIFISIC